MNDNFFLGNITYIALVIIAILTYKRWYNKKHGIEEKQEEIKSTKFNQSYLYKVFVERVKDRPSTHYFVFIFFVSFFIVYLVVSFYWINPLLKFEELEIEKGIVVDVSTPRRGDSTITLLLDNNKKRVFKINAERNLKEKTLNKKVTVYYQNIWFVIKFVDMALDIEVDNVLIKDYKNKFYKNSLGDKEETQPWIINSSISMIICIFFIWVMNRKELPIHVQNRQKRLDKKDK